MQLRCSYDVSAKLRWVAKVRGLRVQGSSTPQRELQTSSGAVHLKTLWGKEGNRKSKIKKVHQELVKTGRCWWEKRVMYR